MAKTIDSVAIRMYKMGTGDCFLLLFQNDQDTVFKMLIDCGCWRRSSADILPFLKELCEDVEDHLDLLVVTHEHMDHVLGFQVGEELFVQRGLKVDRIWMGWTENDGDEKVRRWKKDYGQKKRALAVMANKLGATVQEPGFRQQFDGSRGAGALLSVRQRFSDVLGEFSELHFGVAPGEYVEGLKGMKVVKELFPEANRSYFEPGDVVERISGLDGVRIYVLGPPTLYDEAKTEHGAEGESYRHNKDLDDTNLFLKAVKTGHEEEDWDLLPFHYRFCTKNSKHKSVYDDETQAWRRIDYDWLFSSGDFALRMNSLTNNLSLALAIEFTESKKVLLFPGDAEFGSWRSWHDINWEAHVPGLRTRDLLSRTVFYKVAHHLSHNGTAKSLGLDLMTSPQLVAMATLDYGVISSGWKTTMPNRAILKQLLKQTKGRTILMNTEGLFYDLDNAIPLQEKVEEARSRMSAAELSSFQHRLDEDSPYFTEFVVDVS